MCACDAREQSAITIKCHDNFDMYAACVLCPFWLPRVWPWVRHLDGAPLLLPVGLLLATLQRSVSVHTLLNPRPLQIFIFMTGVFVSSWMGTAALSLGEWIIKKLPLVKHVYSAAKQVTAGLNPENENAKSFRECVLIRHPRHGEYAFGFITGETILQVGYKVSCRQSQMPMA